MGNPVAPLPTLQLDDHLTAGLDVQYEPTKNQFIYEPERLRHFRDHLWEALGEENPNLL